MSVPGNGSAEPGVAHRLRRHLTRFEPAVTRYFLLGIFTVGLTAQFVKPVGDALEDKTFLGGALLSLVAYVLYDAVQDLAASLRLPERSQVGSRELGRFVDEAFRARTVEITFLGYTGETIVGPLYRRLEDLLDDPGPTRRVCIRVLVPDFGQPMTVPSRVGPTGEPLDDSELRRSQERRCQGFDEALSVLAERLNRLGRVTVESEFRLYPGIPRDKICILNRELVLHGLYDVLARLMLRSSGPEYYDPKGHRADLNVWSAKDTDTTRAAVATWNQHLDGLWSLATVPPWRRVTAT
ncbi:hypothetical protein [Streptomyces sp. MMG1533]|uniref:hypothetical protein n=1 Tax=Streptomyces sp. MMG1533 TaxID=1415546 RepID=UPI0006AF34C2|nr:hypothetical protein [Streptomyces sp. MMG1533]